MSEGNSEQWRCEQRTVKEGMGGVDGIRLHELLKALAFTLSEAGS